MIIKVMTRKDASFRQLIDYVNKDAADARYVLTHNLLAPEPGDIAAEFEANARLLRQRANGTVMFHDIVSITRSKSLGLERQKEILKDIARDYITRRAPDHLVYAGLHEDHTKHLHYHFIISANPVGDWKRAHLSKPQLRTLQTDIERHVLARYPDLEQQPTMARKARGAKVSQPGQELLRRTGKVPERQRITDAITAVFVVARDDADLFAKLTNARLELYERGKSVGVRDLDTGRNHRLSTLGLDEAFKNMRVRLETAPAAVITVGLADPPVPPQIPAPTPSIQSSLSPQSASRPAAQTANQPATSTSPPLPQEDPVNIFDLALNGLGAIADALSIAPRTVKPVEDHVNKVKARVGKITARKGALKDKLRSRLQPAETEPQVPLQGSSLRPVPAQTKNVRHAVNNTLDTDLSPDQVRILNDARQLTYNERLAEITELRQQQDQQRDHQRDTRLKR